MPPNRFESEVELFSKGDHTVTAPISNGPTTTVTIHYADATAKLMRERAPGQQAGHLASRAPPPTGNNTAARTNKSNRMAPGTPMDVETAPEIPVDVETRRLNTDGPPYRRHHKQQETGKETG